MSYINKMSAEVEILPETLKNHTQKFLDQYVAKLHDMDKQLPDDKELIVAIVKVFSCSQFVAESCIRNPDLLIELVSSKDLYSSHVRENYSNTLQQLSVSTEVELMVELRKFRYREMVRIAWRDLAGWSELSETLADLSLLAEHCIQFALNFIYQQACTRFGVPLLADGGKQELVVLGMGKLGAWELNFSSDIDLIFAYAEEGEFNDRKQTTYGEFFARVSRRLVKVLDELTADGFVFRTDTRLRPFGDSGPIVMSFDGMENYYQTQAREWERYAMIKARQVAGNEKTGAKLMAMLQPFVYRRYLDYGAFEELRSLKFQIIQELQRKDKTEDIKLGPGGIREIEFIGQAFQLIRGGNEKSLQKRAILTILKTLGELQLLATDVAQELQKSYTFLRRVENHIQQYQDKQTHNLPADPVQQIILAFSLDFADWEAFKAALDNVRKQVHSVFELIFSRTDEQEVNQDCQSLWMGEADSRFMQQSLQSLGYQQPKQTLTYIANFKNSATVKRLTTKGVLILNRLMPQLFVAIPTVKNPDETLKRMLNLFEAVAGRNVYLALLAENPDALLQLIKLASASLWLSDYLSQYPVLFDELLDTRSLYEPLNNHDLKTQLQNHLSKNTSQDFEQLMILLRQFKHINVLRVAAADIMHVIPVTVVSDYLTWIAEVILEQVVVHSWDLMVAKHGLPPDAKNQTQGFAVLGLGKLGGVELGYGSDLDMVFLYDCQDSNALTNGNKPISCAQFYARLGQKVMHVLNTNMLSGVLYEADMRLRPSGNSGLLVNKINAYEDYLLNEAWTWEHQALVRGRCITGDKSLCLKFSRIREKVLCLGREENKLQQEVREMREKMRENLALVKPGQFDIKQSNGGIADIEFIVQFKVLAHAADNKQLLACTDNIRIIQGLQEFGFIQDEVADILTQAYCLYREIGHRETLQGNPAVIAEQEVTEVCSRVKQIWQDLMH